MRMWRDLQDVIKMVSEGGMQVVTLVAEPEGDITVSSTSSTYQGKIYDRRGIRTTIQFDSDYVTTLSPETLSMPELWKRHTTILQEKLIILQRIHGWVQRSWLLFLLFPMGTFIFDVMAGGYSVLLAAAIVLARTWIVRFLYELLRPPVLAVARWYAQWRFRRFVSMPAQR